MDMNMDVKDLFAKLKKKDTGEKKAKSGNGIMGFFDKNPKMKIIIPVLLLVISVAAALTIIFTTGKVDVDSNAPVVPPNADEQLQVLPESVINRENFDDTNIKNDVFDEVDIANAEITMIMNNADGYYTATMVTPTKSYPSLQVGDKIDGSEWLVENITDDTVTISVGEKKIDLKF